ncbi:IS30 family transposase [Mycolicibacterium fluoranthenivorans]|uniref:IS30 family transposase n=1 Tax=Mycolicibacterium fluoranthenivorans TaxID=258505 RepID=A0A7G8PDZ1_9MYCO|nr:IS30 family transposase [Mycolicibacterium fluoranthenivorans]
MAVIAQIDRDCVVSQLRLYDGESQQRGGGQATVRRSHESDQPPPGHWEGGLIIGATGGSAIATLVERSSRYVMLAYLGRKRSADAVRDRLIATVGRLPESLRETLTWHQGSETFSMSTDMAVYFADPGAPWQRGTQR